MISPLPDLRDARLAAFGVDLAPSAFAEIDRSQCDMALAAHEDVLPIAFQREADNVPVRLHFSEPVHPYSSHILHPARKVTKRTQRVNAGEYPKLTLRSFGEKS